MKIRNFDIQTLELNGVTGDVQNGIEFDNGQTSWAARSRVKAVKEFIKE